MVLARSLIQSNFSTSSGTPTLYREITFANKVLGHPLFVAFPNSEHQDQTGEAEVVVVLVYPLFFILQSSSALSLWFVQQILLLTSP